MENGLGLVLGIMAGCLVLWFVFWLFIQVPIEMATARKRNAFVWVLVSVVGSPFLAIFLLWLLGDAETA